MVASFWLIDASSGFAQEGKVDAVLQVGQATSTPTSKPTSTPTATIQAPPVTPVATGEPVEELDGVVALPIGKVDQYDGMTVGFTEAGDPYMGDPDAPVTLYEYSDYLCPFCSRHFNQTLPTLVQDYISTGKLQYVFLDNPIASLHPGAEIGHVAARCVGEQSSSQYWAMHDALFSRQSEWSSLPSPRQFLDTVAASLGVDMQAYTACLWSERQVEVVAARITQAGTNGVTGTPTFDFVRNGDGERFTLVGANPVTVYGAWLDALLDGEDPPIVEEPKAELPYWANAEGLAPDPDRPGFTLAGDPYKGSPDALLTIIEFSDFQCPACASHVNDVQPAVDSGFVETDQVRWVFKNFPLRIHPRALAAATAAECAADQDTFWPMHDLLFALQDQWADEKIEADVDAALIPLAEELDLDVELFRTCLGSRQALERVLPDMYDAQGVVNSTPTFIFLDGESGTLSKGSKSVDDFSALVTQFLPSVESP